MPHLTDNAERTTEHDAQAGTRHARLRGLIDAQPIETDALREYLAKDVELEPLMNNHVELLNGYGPQDLGTPIDWLHAPRGDLQWTTHLSRHYWLLPLAAAYHTTRDERYAQKVVDVLLDWVEGFPIGVASLERGRPDWTNPSSDPTIYEGFLKGYCDGPWTSLSAHVRFDSWCQLLQLIDGSAALSETAVDRLLGSLLGDHIEVMIDFPRKMNQFQGIASSLVRCGWYFPDEAVHQRAQQIGWDRMRRWTREQIYPDGSLAECSPNYGIGCVRRLHAILKKARRLGRPEMPELNAAVSRAVHYYALTMDPAGCSPRLAKGGAFVRDELRGFDAAAVEDAKALSAVFPWAGHAAVRTGWDKDADWLFFDMGPRGSGHHDRAQLGLQLTLGQQAVLVDPGYYTYSSEGEDGRFCNHFKTAAAHNAATVDGEGQVSHLPGKEIGPNREAGDYPTSDDGQVFRAAASYTMGFGPDGDIQVTHHRAITYDRAAKSLIVDDTFRGEGEHCCKLHWQMAPNAVVEIDAQRVKIEAGEYECAIETRSETPVTIETVHGQRDPILGWYSKGYGHLTPTNTLVVSAQHELPMSIQTRISWNCR